MRRLRVRGVGRGAGLKEPVRGPLRERAWAATSITACSGHVALRHDLQCAGARGARRKSARRCAGHGCVWHFDIARFARAWHAVAFGCEAIAHGADVAVGRRHAAIADRLEHVSATGSLARSSLSVPLLTGTPKIRLWGALSCCGVLTILMFAGAHGVATEKGQ